VSFQNLDWLIVAVVDIHLTAESTPIYSNKVVLLLLVDKVISDYDFCFSVTAS